MIQYHKFDINETFDVDTFENTLFNIYSEQNEVKFIFDLRELSITLIPQIILLKPVLDRFRKQTKEYLIHSFIIVKNKAFKLFLDNFIGLIQPEKPIYICTFTPDNKNTSVLTKCP